MLGGRGRRFVNGACGKHAESCFEAWVVGSGITLLFDRESLTSLPTCSLESHHRHFPLTSSGPNFQPRLQCVQSYSQCCKLIQAAIVACQKLGSDV